MAVTTISTTTQQYVDIDMAFLPNPITGDVNVLRNQNAIKQSVVDLVMMLPYEFPKNPSISTSVNAQLFATDTPFNREIIKTNIIATLTKFEQRIQIINVTVTPISNNYISNNTVLKEKILKSNNYSAPPSFDHLIFNLKYATQIARIFYSRIKVPLPAKNDLEGIWNYYKVHYNTVGGKATESEFMNNYLKFVKKGSH